MAKEAQAPAKASGENIERFGYKQELRRGMGLWDVVLYGVLFMVIIAPQSIFGTIQQNSHGMTPLVYIIGFVAILFTAMSYMRMSKRFPIAGSVYCDMGIFGAGLATAIGAAITCLVMVSHFFTRKCTLRLVRPKRVLLQTQQILVTGFSTFFIDVAMGILTMLFNRQIMRCISADGLSVYGIIVNVSTIVQCCAYSIGQAAQPIISRNLGAKEWTRIRQTLRYALYAVAGFSLFWTVLTLAVPNGIVRVFMAPTESVLAVAPSIIRSYCISFLLLPLNIFSTYYFQALMKPGAALVVSVSRGLVISGVLIYALPALFAPETLWFAMPVTELIVAVFVVWRMAQYTRALGKTRPAASQTS